MSGSRTREPGSHTSVLQLFESGAAGLGNPVARFTLLAIWALILLYTLTASELGGAFWHVAPVFAISAAVIQGAAGVAGAIVLTRRGDERLMPRDATVVAACAWIGATVVVQFAEPGTNLWAYNYMSFLAGMLIARGNWIAGMAAAGAVLGTGLSWTLVSGGGLPEIGAVLGMPALVVSICTIWSLWFSWVLDRERRNRATAARDALAEQTARDAIAQSMAELHAVQRQATPVLQSIADGVSLNDEFRELITAVEAGIRDRLRAPWLRNPVLMRAVARARKRGVMVQVLGELSEGEPVQAVADELALAVERRLDVAGSGTDVTIRLLPPHASGRLSVVVRSPELSAESNNQQCSLRVTYATDGTEIQIA